MNTSPLDGCCGRSERERRSLRTPFSFSRRRRYVCARYECLSASLGDGVVRGTARAAALLGVISWFDPTTPLIQFEPPANLLATSLNHSHAPTL